MAPRNKRRMARLVEDESGTALTEFVIILPVFLLILMGAMQLGELSRQSVRVKANASTATWKEALAVHETGPSNPEAKRMEPRLAANDARSGIQKQNTPHGDHYALDKNQGLAARGTAGEAEESLRIVGNTSSLGTPGGSAPGSDVDDFPQDIVGDQGRNPIDTGSGALSKFNGSSALSRVAPNPVMAAGTRYGMVVGKETETVTVGGRSFDLAAGYDTLVSPVAVDGSSGELATIGFSRLAAHQDDCLGNILKIGFEFDYIGNCI